MNAGFAVFLDSCGFVSAPQFDSAHRNSFSAKFIECGLGILHFKQPRNLAVELLLRLVPILGMRVKRIGKPVLKAGQNIQIPSIDHRRRACRRAHLFRKSRILS